MLINKTSIRKGMLDVRIHEILLLDGGGGALENIVYGTGGIVKEAEVYVALGRTQKAPYGILKDTKTAVIEMVQASGLPLLAEMKETWCMLQVVVREK